jgi:hypothetical protein
VLFANWSPPANRLKSAHLRVCARNTAGSASVFRCFPPKMYISAGIFRQKRSLSHLPREACSERRARVCVMYILSYIQKSSHVQHISERAREREDGCFIHPARRRVGPSAASKSWSREMRDRQSESIYENTGSADDVCNKNGLQTNGARRLRNNNGWQGGFWGMSSV